MNSLRHLFRTKTRKAACSRRLRARPFLEGLETRLAPSANVFVVPISQPADSTHFHSLTEALPAAGDGGVVTIEPGTTPDVVLQNQPVQVTQNFITIQGDPRVPANILPSYQLALMIGNATLTNLNLGSLQVGSLGNIAPFTHVSKCLIGSISAFDASSTYSQNIITGAFVIRSDGHFGGDTVANNTFSSRGHILTIDSAPGTFVTQNTFYGEDGVAILVLNCGALNNVPTTIANNTITFPGTGGTGITVKQAGSGSVDVSNVKIFNNLIPAHGLGLYLDLSAGTGDINHFIARIEGNDFNNNQIGVRVDPDALGAPGDIDMGVVTRGGNNFRDFTTATSTNAAIALFNVQGTVVAKYNMFVPGVDPYQFVYGAQPGNHLVLTGYLDTRHAFVQQLYNGLLGRTGAAAELDAWVSLITSDFDTQGRAAVANDILHSNEALGRIVDSFYLRFLGRQSDAAGRAGWVNFLQHGGTEEQLETLFLTSPEYIGHINVDFVQSLYLNILGRPGSPSELAGWNNNIQSLGLAGIANGFVRSAENRANTVTSYFQTFIHRPPTNSELTPLVNSAQDLLALEGKVLSSDEFFFSS
jgi:Periplasmic copper-binding protein (NosD)/Domain of unknown function (DUF4214)